MGREGQIGKHYGGAKEGGQPMLKSVEIGAIVPPSNSDAAALQGKSRNDTIAVRSMNKALGGTRGKELQGIWGVKTN